MRNIILMIILALFTLSCNHKKNSRVNIEKSDLKKNTKIKIYRYEKAFLNIDTKNIKSELKKISKDYNFFIGDIDFGDTLKLIEAYNFITDPGIRTIYKDCIEKYPDLNDVENQFNTAFSYFAYYFPEKKIPKVYTYISGLYYEQPVTYADSVIIIALDDYLGQDYKSYPELGIPAYRFSKMRKEYIVSDCMKEIARSFIIPDKSKNSFLDRIIFEGKILYFADAMMPDMHDTIKIGYSSSQLKWCESNEANIWSLFIDRNILYKTDIMTINKFTGDGPFTTGLAKESPARIGSWIGWQIVRSYMDNNKNVNMKTLISNYDSQNILQLSKYKPKK